jgi:hypothetical protein
LPRKARLDAQYVNDEAGAPADSTHAAHCNDRDFGTSRFSSTFGQNTPHPAAEKGWADSGRPAMLPKMTDADWITVLKVFEASRSRRGDKGRDDKKFLSALHYPRSTT